MKDNTKTVIILLIAAFIVLAMGQLYLYRNQQHLNKMVSEGFMQIKEDQQKEAEKMLIEEPTVDTMKK